LYLFGLKDEGEISWVALMGNGKRIDDLFPD